MPLLLPALLQAAASPPANIQFVTTGTAPVRLHGRLRDEDFPLGLVTAVAPAKALLRYTVGLDGRVRNCRALEHTRATELEETACALIVKRFRFRPARDASGREVEADIVETHQWLAGPPPGR